MSRNIVSWDHVRNNVDNRFDFTLFEQGLLVFIERVFGKNVNLWSYENAPETKSIKQKGSSSYTR